MKIQEKVEAINKTECAWATMENDNIKIEYCFNLSKAEKFGYDLDECFTAEPEQYNLDGEINISDNGSYSSVSLRENSNSDMEGYQIDFSDNLPKNSSNTEEVSEYIDTLLVYFEEIDEIESQEEPEVIGSYYTSENIFQNTNLSIGRRNDDILIKVFSNESLNPGDRHEWTFLCEKEEITSIEDLIQQLLSEEKDGETILCQEDIKAFDIDETILEKIQ